MSEKFSPQAVKVMQEIAKLGKPFDVEHFESVLLKELLALDTRGEVLVRLRGGKVTFVRRAMQGICDSICGKDPNRGVESEKAILRLVYSSGPEKPKESDQQDGKPENLPEGQKAE